MLVLVFRSLILSLVMTTPALGQVALIQWSDAHSTLESLGQQARAIDLAGQNFLKAHPEGEFVVHVLGDFTSLNPYSEEDLGWRSFKVLKILKDRGYTVLYTPGNHDAFDWTVKVKGARLFLEQMETLKSWGIPVLSANFITPSPRLSAVLSPSYKLDTVQGETHIVGLTLEALLTKSNLNDDSSQGLFKAVQSYREFAAEYLPLFEKQGWKQVIFAAHQAHSKVASFVRHSQALIQERNFSLKIPLALASHDHQVAAYRLNGTLISDGGSHGAFNIIQISKTGEISSPIRHIAMSEERASRVDRHQVFKEGEVFLNPIDEEDIQAFPALFDHHQEVESYLLQKRKTLDRVLFHTQGVESHKEDMKKSRTELGTLLAETLKSWARSFLPMAQEEILAMANSSSYRKEEFLPPGPVREIEVRQMYPYLDQASLYRLSGAEIEKLFFSLRDFYLGGQNLYTPQLSQNIRERNRRLEIQTDGHKWSQLIEDQSYLLALDGWLSEHRHGQSYRVREWVEILGSHKTVAKKPYQELLVKFLPAVFETYEEERQSSHRRAYVYGSSCKSLL